MQTKKKSGGAAQGCGIGCGGLLILMLIAASPTLGLSLAVATLLVWGSWYLANRNEIRRRRWLAQRELEEQQRYFADLDQRALSYVQRFVAATFPPRGAWPEPVRDPDSADLAALVTILERQQIPLPSIRVLNLVRCTLADQNRRQFWSNFVAYNPWLPQSPSPEQWARAYVDTFENNLDHLPLMSVVSQLRGTPSAPGQLQSLVIAAIQQRAHERRVQEVSQAVLHGAVAAPRRRTIAEVDRMTGVEFEQLLAQLFRGMGYQVQLTKASGDQGADLILEKLGERTVVQAKRYSHKLDNTPIQEALGAKGHYRCHRALVVTNNYYTGGAKQLATSNGVSLWDRDQLAANLAQYLSFSAP